jgi:hypothetical protein
MKKLLPTLLLPVLLAGCVTEEQMMAITNSA